MVSFLGRVKMRTESGEDPGYAQTEYLLDARTLPGTTFATAAIRVLNPERVVVLGTEGSTWVALLPNSLVKTGDFDELIAAGENASVRAEMLQRLEPVLEDTYGRPFVLRLIPPGRNVDEQTAILDRIAQTLESGDEVLMDVTHGYRHLPLIAMVSAWYLERVRAIRVRHLYYGAYEMGDGTVTPVLRLDGMIETLRWVEAVTQFDKDGDYGVFVHLLQSRTENGAQTGQGDIFDGIKHLERSAYLERIQDIEGARAELMAFLEFSGHRDLPGVGRLFSGPFRERLEWVKSESTFTRYKQVAASFLRRRDYLRATIYLFEAFKAKLAQELGLNPGDYRDRDKAQDRYHNCMGTTPAGQDYKLLRILRNTLAHGSLPDKAEERELVEPLLVSPDRLEAELCRLLDEFLSAERFLPETDPAPGTPARDEDESAG